MSKKYYYSEIFNSIQGEGRYTGHPTAWLRFYLCNLQCNGFGQEDPTNPDTYDLPFEKIDLKDITRVEDLPVFEKGCDSSYTWSKRFKHLMHHETPAEIADRIRDILRTESNPEGYFLHPRSQQTSHMCFTGGEPLIATAQKCVVDILEIFKTQPGGLDVITGLTRGTNIPSSVTFETNGTKPLTDDFISYFGNRGRYNSELFFSVSPKLWTVAGEDPNKAIKPDVVKQYCDLGNSANVDGQLKFVVGPKKEQWDEVEDVIDQFRQAGVKWPIWIMPTGARVEEQEMVAGDVAKMAYERGYNVSARVHTYLWGNAIGT